MRQLFPLAELEPAYEKAVWLYVYRDFSEDDRDRADERIALRFGFSSYPQHKLVDPHTLEIIGDTDRSVDSFLAAVDNAKVDVPHTSDAHAALVEAEKRAIALESRPTVRAAEAALDDDDIVVQLRGLAVLAEEQPEAIVERASDLLAVPNDNLRYAACDALAAAGDESAARALDALVKDPSGSLNPNVLRMHAVNALARCGDAESVDALGPLVDGSQYRNSLMRTVITTLAGLAERLHNKEVTKRVRDILAAEFPEPQEDEREQRMAVALAKTLHKALEDVTGRNVKFPSDYDAKARNKLVGAWD